MEHRRLKTFFYVLLRKHMTYDDIQAIINKAAAYEKDEPGMAMPPADHPLFRLAETLASRVLPVPPKPTPATEVEGPLVKSDPPASRHTTTTGRNWK